MDTADNATMDSPQVINAEALLERIAAGELTKNLAAELELPKGALRYLLRKHPGYKQAVSDQAETLVERQLDELMTVKADSVLIARARERYRAALEWAKARDAAVWDNRQMLVTTNQSAPQLEGMGQLELARRVAWILTSGAAAARAQQALLSAPQESAPQDDQSDDLPTD